MEPDKERCNNKKLSYVPRKEKFRSCSNSNLTQISVTLPASATATDYNIISNMEKGINIIHGPHTVYARFKVSIWYTQGEYLVHSR